MMPEFKRVRLRLPSGVCRLPLHIDWRRMEAKYHMKTFYKVKEDFNFLLHVGEVGEQYAVDEKRIYLMFPNGDQCGYLLEELDLLSTEKCSHKWVYMQTVRQQGYTGHGAKNWKRIDRFYCEKCLEINDIVKSAPAYEEKPEWFD